jgi:hypothetical protein
MRRLSILVFVTGCIIGAAFLLQGAPRVRLTSLNTIHAGDAWEVTVSVSDSAAGEQVQVMLLNGLRTFEETLTLGAGGVAVWRIPSGQITQAGDSILIVRYNGEQLRRILHVMAEPPAIADLFTTANSLFAYGDSSATIMLLPRDRWGNAPHGTEEFSLDIRYPDGTRIDRTFTYRGGLGHLSLRSQGGPGRVRLALDHDRLDQSLELHQSPGPPHRIALTLEPTCVLNDGRDLLSLSATVHDSGGHFVADGTLVTFIWLDGIGRAQTINGVARLRLPAPDHTSLRSYRAIAGDAEAAPVFLRVNEEGCPDDD